LPDGTDAVFISACDLPLIKPAFVRRMIDLLGDFDACVPGVGDRLHPLAAVYRRRVLIAAERLLSTGPRSLTRLCSAVRTRIVTADELADVDPSLLSLRNVNTPEEYSAAVGDVFK
jgi:molybdenum cofactor guanylyltransferase